MSQSATLPLQLKQLKLTSMGRNWEALLQQAQQRGRHHAQYLARLCEQELAERYSRRIDRHTKESKLPVGKTLATYDFKQLPTQQAGQIEALPHHRLDPASPQRRPVRTQWRGQDPSRVRHWLWLD